MNIPGAIAKHAIITDVCRNNHGNTGAIDEASRRVKEEYLECVKRIDEQNAKGFKFHVIMSVERP